MENRKVALVTGGSRGIGAAICIKLAKEGYDIAINYEKREDKALDVLHQVEAIGQKGIIVQADVASYEQVMKMHKTIVDSLGEVDLLVSNAGIAGQVQIQDLSIERWNRFFGVNVTGSFNAIQAVIPNMLKEHKGCIITISSMWGLRGASCESAYSATKAALIGFSRSLATELAPTNIRVNCIAPGVIKTDMLDELPSDILSTLADETPLRRLGTPEDIANTVAFLASDEASFITGQVITCDGGFIV